MDKLEESKMKELLVKASKGNKTAFEEIYRQNEKMVYFICFSFLKNEHDADDVSQEVWISVVKNLKTLGDSNKFVPWLNRITVNKCKDFLKKKKPIPVAEENLVELVTEEEELFLPEEYISVRAKRKIIMDIMRDTLSDVLYQTIFLFYFSNMSISEIAEIMECPEGTVSYRLSAARAKIKEGVLKYEKENSDKLHSIAFIPFLFAVFNAEMQSLKSHAMPVGISSFFTSQNTAAVKAAEKGVKAMFKTFKAKIIAAVAVIVLVVSGIIGAVVISGNSDNGRKHAEISKNNKEQNDDADKDKNPSSQGDGNIDNNNNNNGNEDGQNGETGNDIVDGDADYTAMAEAAVETIENYFIALKAGDVDTLLELTDPNEDCYDILEDLSEQDYTSEFLSTMFGNLQYLIDDQTIELLAKEISDSYEYDRTVITAVYLPYSRPLFLEQWYYYSELYEPGTEISKPSVSGDRESMELIAQIVEMLPMVQGSLLDITRPDENGNILIHGDKIFDPLNLDRLKRTDSGLPTRYVYDIMCVRDGYIKGDDGIYSEYEYEKFNDGYIKVCEFMQNKDFEGLRQWSKEYMGDESSEATWANKAEYSSLTESQKKWVDDFINEKVNFTFIDYLPKQYADGSQYRGATMILTYPVLEDAAAKYDNVEWYDENNVMEYSIMLTGGAAGIGEFDSFSWYYNRILYYAQQYVE